MSSQMVRNAQALGEALSREGFDMLAKEQGYTRTHQVFPRIDDRGAYPVVMKCIDCNILAQTAPLIGDGPRPEERSGIRLSVGEITRLGMNQRHMTQIARFIRRASDGESPTRVSSDIENFLKDFQTPRYTFNA